MSEVYGSATLRETFFSPAQHGSLSKKCWSWNVSFSGGRKEKKKERESDLYFSFWKWLPTEANQKIWAFWRSELVSHFLPLTTHQVKSSLSGFRQDVDKKQKTTRQQTQKCSLVFCSSLYLWRNIPVRAATWSSLHGHQDERTQSSKIWIILSAFNTHRQDRPHHKTPSLLLTF